MLRLTLIVLMLQGGSGIQTVTDLHQLLKMHAPASESVSREFQNPASGAGLLTGGCETITLPLDVAQQMISYPAVDAAVAKFEQDWLGAFGRTSI